MNERQKLLNSIACQILTTAPVFKKRLFRPEIEQTKNPIPLSYVQVLAALNEVEKLSVSEISSRFDIAKPNITPLIDRLIEAGYVKRVRNSKDRRVVYIVIEDAGREKVQETVNSLKKSIETWSENFEDEKLEKLSDAISTIREIFDGE